MRDFRKFISFIVLFTFAFTIVNNLFPYPIFTVGVSSLLIYLLFLWWDKYLWKNKNKVVKFIGNILGFFDYPNLDGEWNASYKSSYKHKTSGEYQTNGRGVATINQTYSGISLDIEWKESNSESFVIKLQQKEHNGKWCLVVAYINRPKESKLQNSPDGKMHNGFCYLELSERASMLEGFYSNDENRKTRGYIKLIKRT